MFPKLSSSLLATSLMVPLAVANYPAPPPGTVNLCCTYVTSNTDSLMQSIASLYDVNLFGVPNNIGFDCTPINILGNQWYDSAHPVAVLPADDILCSSNTAVNCDLFPLDPRGLFYGGCVPISF
ncbi:hypothetical protein GGX14DRAFT_568745 [Mycena pura]|uniref:Hydrophobin n=1 Tax=Mycena pura TaxID=153505 RepID=A0AAD6YED3_9AGAR|nr:hypothetical protein GGX14DRAFT_568745 [Mycena pura]